MIGIRQFLTRDEIYFNEKIPHKLLEKTNIEGLTKPNFGDVTHDCAMNLHISGYLVFIDS